jgi:hypothetical protein
MKKAFLVLTLPVYLFFLSWSLGNVIHSSDPSEILLLRDMYFLFLVYIVLVCGVLHIVDLFLSKKNFTKIDNRLSNLLGKKFWLSNLVMFVFIFLVSCLWQ